MKGLLKKFDWVAFAVMVALIAVGTIAIRSAGCARTEMIFHGMWVNNLTTAIFGLLLYLVIAFTDYRKYLSVVSWPAYGTAVFFLVAVLVFGSTVYGGKRWLWFFQPSEISKLCIIMLIASLFGDSEAPRSRFGFVGFVASAILIGVPAALILAEPDLGTTLTLVPAVLVMLLMAGVWRKGMLTIIIAVGILAAALLGAVYEAERPGVSAERRERIMKYVPLKPHQVRRVKVFLFPEEDLRGDGYNLRQAKISIGSGGLNGKGIGKGETNHLKYLPQAISMNDFIFCVWAEETGFIGSLLLLSLFGILLVSGCRAAFVATDGRGRLLAIGVSTLVFAHVYINIAMSIGVVPITGLPLPFISSGRTFLITVMCGLGLIQSVTIHTEKERS